MTTQILSALLLAALVWGYRQWRGKQRYKEHAAYNQARYRYLRKQWHQLSKAHQRNESIFRQMRRITNQPEN